MLVIKEFIRNCLILCFRIASIIFLIGCPLVMLLKRIFWRFWLIDSIVRGVILTLAPLRSLSDRFEYMNVIEHLEGGQRVFLLPAPSPPKKDINRATVEELREIEGVGFVRALEIVEYRERYGDYRRLEELGMIPGIGAKTLQLIAEQFKV